MSSSIPRFDIIHKAIGCEYNCCQMNRFLAKAAVSILSESLQLPPNNEFVMEEWQELRRATNTF